MSKYSKNAWLIKIVLISFFVSIIFSLISELAIPKVSIFVGVIITLIFIFIGIIFDMIGVSVTSSDEAIFNSMAASKVKGAKCAVWMKKNADKVSSLCNDVTGDICGIISGSTGAVIALKIIEHSKFNGLIVTVLVMAIISSLTIGGKACVKNIAIKKSEKILFRFAKVVNIFARKG